MSWIVYEQYPNGYPDTAEIERAIDVIGHSYMGGDQDEYYAEKYGDLPCLAMAPDGGLLMALHCLYEAVGRLEGLEK